MLNLIFSHIIELCITVIIAFITYLHKKLKKYNKTIQYTKDGVKALLKNKIIEKYNYYKNLDLISIFDKQIINELYREYHNLGGNGIIDELMEYINALPIDSNIKKTIQDE